MRDDPTPLPKPRPPTIDFPAFEVGDKKTSKPARSLRGWLYALLFVALAAAAIARLAEIDARDRAVIAAARDEAAEHRLARFAAEADVKRLSVENQRLTTALAAAKPTPVPTPALAPTPPPPPATPVPPSDKNEKAKATP